jgi:predicted phosphodiesterase
MRIALLADVHGNSIALERCLAVLRSFDPDATYFLGDCVGYIPGEQECLELLSASNIACQRGNHEQMLLFPTQESEGREDVYGLAAVARRTSAAAMHTIGSWPIRRELEIDGRRILLVHGSPDSALDGYVYPDADLSSYRGLPYDAVLMANTHRPFVRRIGDTVMANVGSVGLPRDVGRLSSVATYDAQANEVSILRPTLDIEAVLTRWGNRMHSLTRACLLRTAPEFVGEVIR